MKTPDTKQLVIKIGKLWNSSEGSTEKRHLSANLEFPEKDKIVPTSSFEAEILLIKLKDEINVIIQNASLEVEMTCDKCLNKFKSEICFKDAERRFLSDDTQESEEDTDIYHIALKDMTIDLYDMVRQEIILHFPLISVCSKRCKGLCQKCGKNQNTEKCQCEDEKTALHRPLSNLKKIIS